MADRGPVKIRTGNVDDLINIYKKSYENVSKEIINATTAGKIQRARVMVRINAELTALGVNVEEWVNKEIPKYYLDGANQAIQDLKSLGVDVTKDGTIVAINREAINALVYEVNAAFGDSIKTMSRSARKLLVDAQKQQINAILAMGKIEGKTAKAIAASIKEAIQDNGLGVLIDKSGRRWSFDAYSEMLVRTKVVESRNQGLANRMLQNGYDLVQVSNHRSDHPECAQWEGKILSLTGETPKGTKLPGGYTVAGTVQEATDSGLFHPNCKHAINVINPSLAAKTKAYDNPYNFR